MKMLVDCTFHDFVEMGGMGFSPTARSRLHDFYSEREKVSGKNYIIVPEQISNQWFEFDSFEDYLCETGNEEADSLEELSKLCDVIMTGEESFLMSVKKYEEGYWLKPVPFDDSDYLLAD